MVRSIEIPFLLLVNHGETMMNSFPVRGHQAPAPSRQVHAESGLKFPVLDPRGIDQQTRAHLLNMKSHSRPEQVPVSARAWVAGMVSVGWE